jgi:hypothetical protein
VADSLVHLLLDKPQDMGIVKTPSC